MKYDLRRVFVCTIFRIKILIRFWLCTHGTQVHNDSVRDNSIEWRKCVCAEQKKREEIIAKITCSAQRHCPLNLNRPIIVRSSGTILNVYLPVWSAVDTVNGLQTTHINNAVSIECAFGPFHWKVSISLHRRCRRHRIHTKNKRKIVGKRNFY